MDLKSIFLILRRLCINTNFKHTLKVSKSSYRFRY